MSFSNYSTIWEMLKIHNVVEGELPEIELRDHNPWYIRCITGFAAWLASLFFLGFLGVFIWELISDSESLGLSIIGGLLCLGAFFIYTHIKSSLNSHDFLSQVALCLSLCGQLCFAIALLIDNIDHSFPFFVLFAIQAILAFTLPNYLHRVLCTWFASLALFWAFSVLGLSNLAIGILLATFIAIWLNEAHWKQKRQLFEAFGFGLAIALLQLNGQVLFVGDIVTRIPDSPPVFWKIVNLVIYCGLMYAFLSSLSDKIKIQWQGANTLWLSVLLLVFAITSWLIPSAACAIFLLLTGFRAQRISLTILGALALITFVSWYYYSLEWSLLYKSLVLIGIGLGLMATRLLAKISRKRDKSFHLRFKPNLQLAMILFSLALILFSVNFAIYKKEQHLQEGNVVFLKLAPVDPRSLMQGDYMRLRFDIENSLRQSINLEEAQNGFIVVSLDDQGVGQLQRVHQGEPLAVNEITMQFRVRNHRIKFATNAFFFQEGKAAHFDQAEYGEFRVNEEGELLLTAMRDKDLQQL